MLSDEQITKFQTLYKSHFGKEIGREEAHEKGMKLIRLIQIIRKPMTEDECRKVQMRHREIGD